MLPDPLDPSLRELEDLLSRRPRPEPAADFRARVLGAMAGATTTRRRWRLVWRVAAAVIVALNVSMTIRNGVRYRALAPPAVERRVTAFDADDPFQAFAARAVADVTPAPDVGALGRAVFNEKEDRTWASP